MEQPWREKGVQTKAGQGDEQKGPMQGSSGSESTGPATG